MNNTKNVLIFASGSGTNAINIIEHFKKQPNIHFTIFSNKQDAPVLEKAKAINVPTHTFSRQDFYETGAVEQLIADINPCLIVLAGFLWLVPASIVEKYPKKIINIHPSLLPKYGGKGMYGMKVHKEVVMNREDYTGITIHYVNEKYDAGQVILQSAFRVGENDTVEDVAKKVQKLEHEHFPKIVEKLLV
jgi:phosphoribosylglycinamide formyltransferase-1